MSGAIAKNYGVVSFQMMSELLVATKLLLTSGLMAGVE